MPVTSRTKAAPLARYVVRRLALLVLAVFVASTIVFFLLRLLPGDAAATLAGVGATPEQIQATRHELGLDRPLLVQYADWLGGVLGGDFGVSHLSKMPILPEILRRLPITVPLSLAAFVIAVAASLAIGSVAAIRRNRASGIVVSAAVNVAVATPSFWVGILLILVFAQWLDWLPAGGFPRRGWAEPGRAITSLVLPTLTIAFVMTAILIRYVGAAVLDVLSQDYLRTAVALGYSPVQAFRRHAWHNMAGALIAIMMVELATSLLGAVVVENVFALPGLGSLLLDAVRARDLPVVQGIVYLIMVVVLVIGFLGDVLQRVIDPRLLEQGER